MPHKIYAGPVRVGIMQPYFLPHLSYFQLIANTDFFCLHDKVKYTKQSWINRNRIIVNGRIQYMTIPLLSSSDYDLIDEKKISSTFDGESLLKTIELSYKKSPNFSEVFPLMNEIIGSKELNLFNFLENSIVQICRYLGIKTKILRCSGTGYNQVLTKSELVLDICQRLQSGIYINPEGGAHLYSSADFSHKGITLKFSKQMKFKYINSLGQAESSLSVLDTLMWANKESITQRLYEIDFVSV